MFHSLYLYLGKVRDQSFDVCRGEKRLVTLSGEWGRERLVLRGILHNIGNLKPFLVIRSPKTSAVGLRFRFSRSSEAPLCFGNGYTNSRREVQRRLVSMETKTGHSDSYKKVYGTHLLLEWVWLYYKQWPIQAKGACGEKATKRRLPRLRRGKPSTSTTGSIGPCGGNSLSTGRASGLNSTAPQILRTIHLLSLRFQIRPDSSNGGTSIIDIGDNSYSGDSCLSRKVRLGWVRLSSRPCSRPGYLRRSPSRFDSYQVCARVWDSE